MDTSTKIGRFKHAYNLLRIQGKIKTQKDFADLLGYNRSTISLAMGGRPEYLTENLVQKAEFYAAQEDAETKQSHPAAAEQDIVIPAATAKMYADMAESIRILSELVAAQQKGGAAATATTPAANG